MHDHHTHSLLRQLPLTVSPFIHLPVAITLPYTFAPLPSTLPPASPSPPSIVSPSGTMTTTPQAVIQSCHALVDHLKNEKEKADKEVEAWERSIKDRELSEKRRVAPGYLDTGLRMLEPVRRDNTGQQGGSGGGKNYGQQGGRTQGQQGGEELDRVFGGLGLGPGGSGSG